MTMMLRSYDYYGTVVLASDDFDFLKEIPADARSTVTSVCGFYSYGENGPVTAFFYKNGSFHLHVEGHTFDLPRDAALRRSLDKSGRITLDLEFGGRPQTSFTYTPPADRKTFENDPTPFVEDEDFDFSLFLQNVLGNHSRLDLLKEQWRGAT